MSGINKKFKGSKYRGVYRCGSHKWKAQIQIDTVQYYLGVYNTEIEAAIEFNKAAIKFERPEILNDISDEMIPSGHEEAYPNELGNELKLTSFQSQEAVEKIVAIGKTLIEVRNNSKILEVLMSCFLESSTPMSIAKIDELINLHQNNMMLLKRVKELSEEVIGSVSKENDFI